MEYQLQSRASTPTVPVTMNHTVSNSEGGSADPSSEVDSLLPNANDDFSRPMEETLPAPMEEVFNRVYKHCDSDVECRAKHLFLYLFIFNVSYDKVANQGDPLCNDI